MDMIKTFFWDGQPSHVGADQYIPCLSHNISQVFMHVSSPTNMHGTYAAVYRGEFHKAGYSTEVAVKVVKHLDDNGQQRALQREQYAFCGVDHHTNVVFLHYHHEENGCTYFAMDLCDGNLKQFVEVRA